MLDRSLKLQVNLPAVDRIHPPSNKFDKGVKIKAAGDSKLNEA